MNDEEYNQVLDYLTKPDQRHVPREIRNKSEHFEVFDNRLYRKNFDQLLLVVKKNEVDDLLLYAHDHPLGGHFGRDKTMWNITQYYWWPKMGKYVEHYVQTCEQCQRLRAPTRSEPLQSITPIGTMRKWGVDTVGPLPRTQNGNEYLVVAVDYLTKWPEARALPNKQADTVASFIVDDIICRHGVPKELTTDQGTEYKNQLLRYIAKRTSMKHIMTQAYHPQANGQVERMNQTLINMIRKVSKDKPNVWDEHLATILFAYRTTIHSTTKFTPFHLLHGYEAVTPLNRKLAPIGNNEKELQKRQGQLIEILSKRVQARENIRNRQVVQKKNYDRKLQEPTYNPGELVWLDKKTFNELPKQKTGLRLTGPFKVIMRKSNGTYHLEDSKGKLLKKAYSGDKLRRYQVRQKYGEPLVVIEQIEGIHQGNEFPRLVDASEKDN
ncbi:1501_t:CDS:1 [Paraglomus brasilianum]|uniref:1501_t:CDS:1 n=1 Tax=Paraglomus brasilianum TaxID=144538 RepID=A0A9N9GQ20_9GLOM|nr:1501_t:CDS:1 [Paraglomus brasilianum]